MVAYRSHRKLCLVQKMKRCERIGILLLAVAVLTVFPAGSGLAQFPPPPLPFPPDPFGVFGGAGATKIRSGAGSGTGTASQKIIQTLFTTGMEHPPTGQPPFGTDAAGNPIWPLGEEYSPSSSNPTGSTGAAADLTGGTASAMPTIEKIHDLPTKRRADPAVVRPLIADIIPLIQARRASVGNPQLTPDELRRMGLSFLLDLQQHARYSYEGKNAQALALSYKWQSLDRLYPDQIDQITLDIARRKGFPSFEKWIASSIEVDRGFVGKYHLNKSGEE